LNLNLKIANNINKTTSTVTRALKVKSKTTGKNKSKTMSERLKNTIINNKHSDLNIHP